MSTEPASQPQRPDRELDPKPAGGFYQPVPHENNARGETLRMVIIAFALVLFGLTLTVIFILPRYLPDATNPSSREPEQKTAVTVPDVTDIEPKQVDEPEIEPIASADPAEKLADRQSAQNLLGEIDEQFSRLGSQNAAVWAREDFANAKIRLKAGEQAYGEQRYREAISIYTEVKSVLTDLDTRSKSVLTDALAEGEYALASGDAVAAKQAFERALLIQPDHAPAVEGKQRADNLDEVLALINEAKGFEDLGENAQALERYEAALALDAKTSEASEAIARIKAQQTTSSFNAAMTRGLNALEGKKYSQARKHFITATEIKPGDENAKESLQQANELIRSSEIQRHLRNAATAKNKEDWQNVEKSLLAAKKLDSGIANINSQIDTAKDRQTLERQLLKYTSEAHRLSNDDVHLEALSLLDKAKRYTAGPKLKAQIANLQTTINAARTPQRVVMTSDGATAVTVYKVGQFGAFAQKNLDLLPGKYVAVGKRDGYRDVRVEFIVDLNTAIANPVDIRCVEPIQFGTR